MIYFDNAAATKVDDEVLQVFLNITKNYFANPNSSHKLGMEAKGVIDESTSKIAKLLGVLPEEIIYTSGASESNNLVVQGIAERYKTKGKHILISGLEHNSIVAAATSLQNKGFEVEVIPINRRGLVDIQELKKMIRNDTILVSVCTVDSEIGLRQPIEEIGKLVKEYPNCYFHTDSSQAIGKVKVNYEDVDLVTIAPHKFNGLNGIGLLIKKKNVNLVPLIYGGKSTTVYRSGTPDVANIGACAKALEIALQRQDERYEYVKRLSDRIKKQLISYKDVVINSTEISIPYTINFSVKGIKAMDIQEELQKYNIYVSTKTSCCPVMTPSKLVYALTQDKSLATTSVRLSLSHLNTKVEVEEFLRVFDLIYEGCKNGKR